MGMNEALFGRGGHVHEPALWRLALGELDRGAQDQLGAHMARCGRCQTLARELGAPLPPVRLARRPPVHEGWGLVLGGGVAVAAAAMLIALPAGTDPSTPTDGLRLRGTPLAFQVWRDAGEGAGPLAPGAHVHPGDRLGFVVDVGAPGQLMVVAFDDAGSFVQAYPGGPAGQSVPIRPQRVGAVPLPAAVQLDHTLGREHLMAVLCPEAFAFEALAAAVDGGPPSGHAWDGCAVVVQTYTKTRAGALP